MEDELDILYEEYIQENIIRGVNANSDLERLQKFLKEKENIFVKPGLESKLIHKIRENIFEVIDNWLANPDLTTMTPEKHRIYEKVFNRHNSGEDGRRKSKRRKSKY